MTEIALESKPDLQDPISYQRFSYIEQEFLDEWMTKPSEERLDDFYDGSIPTDDWYHPAVLDTLGVFRHNAAQWGRIKQHAIALYRSGKDLEKAVDARLVRDNSTHPLLVDVTSGTFGTSLPWAPPENLPSEVPDVPMLPEVMLPESLRLWLVDTAHRQQVPLEFVAIPAIVALATVIGRKIGIHPKQHDDWLVVPNLWGCIVGRPGVLKTPALKAALLPLDQLIATASERYRKELNRGKAELAAHEARIKALKHAMEQVARKTIPPGGKTLEVLTTELQELEERAPVVFTERRYRTNDSTVEKLAELFKENPTGLLLFRDELSGWLRSLDKIGREGDREFFLEAWNGDGAFTVDRIGRGTVHVPALCLSLCGGIQPGKLEAYIADAVAGSYGDDGLLQRFQLLVWPDIGTSWKNIDRSPDNTARNRAFAVYQALDEVIPSAIGCHQPISGGIPYLHFAAEAQDFFNDWREQLEVSLRDGSMACVALESHLAKYRSLMPSLALLFYLTELALHPIADSAVSFDAAVLAASWCEFLQGHAQRVYAAVASPDITAAHALAMHIKVGDVKDRDSVRSIYRRQWSNLRTVESVENALAVLHKAHWLQVIEQQTGGRVSEIVLLNPDLGKKF